MPRYVYNCESCGGCFQVRHGMKEVQESCQLCFESSTLVRVPQMPSVKKEREQEQNKKIGSVTKEYIQKNKELLNEMKSETRGESYDV